MRKSLMIAAAGLTLAGAAGTVAIAQNAPPPAPTTDTATPPQHPGPHGMGHWMGMGGWMHRHGPGEHARAMPFAPGTFRLFARQPDKHLTPADAQTIAQAILLWNGEHDWKVTQVQSGQDNQVTFAYAAPDGTVIAKFAINQQTGRISRIG